MNLIDNLNWRYATKRYNGKKLTEDQLTLILDAMRLTASSGGLQPYRLFVIDKPEIRAELGKDSSNLQITEASHLIAIASFTSLRQSDVDEHVHRIAKIRGLDPDSLSVLKEKMESYYLSLSDAVLAQWAAKQAYIALGTGLIAAADLKVDSTPMEGFNADKLDDLLGLKEKRLHSVVLLALGYRDHEQDPFAEAKKVRLPAEELVHVI